MRNDAPVGILNINKPPGATSHDVVKQVRRLVGIRKVGHSGTLDPMATGVLLLCLGPATRLIEYLMAGEKVYRATVRLGQSTNTFDAEGQIVAEYKVSGVTLAHIEAILPRFLGTIQQRPPAFSAIKQSGVPAYKLARQGKSVELKTRSVQISEIRLLGWKAPFLELEVYCGPGTYIRSLAHDLGQMLGVGGHLTALSRTASGNWQLTQATTMETLQARVSAGQLADVLHPLEQAVAHLPGLILNEMQQQAIGQGQKIPMNDPAQFDQSHPVAAYDTAGQLVAILDVLESAQLQPKKVFQPFHHPAKTDP